MGAKASVFGSGNESIVSSREATAGKLGSGKGGAEHDRTIKLGLVCSLLMHACVPNNEHLTLVIYVCRRYYSSPISPLVLTLVDSTGDLKVLSVQRRRRTNLRA